MMALCFYGDLPLSAIVTRMYSGVDSFTLLAIPFFIAAGEIMNESGITDKIVSFSKALVGHIKGGLAHVSIVSSMFFSGISGSATADASALGSMLIPAMKKVELTLILPLLLVLVLVLLDQLFHQAFYL